MTRPLQCEALIIGAGPAGASLAVWLAQEGWDCLLVDRAHFPRRKPCAGCFAPRCFPDLRRLGLEDVVKSGQQIRFLDLQVPQRSLRLETAKNPFGPDFYVFPRERFDALLVEKARSHSVRLLEGISIDSLTRQDGWVVGASAAELEIRAKITVVATGANTRFLPPERRFFMRSYQTLIGWFEGFRDLDPFTTDSFCAPWLPGNGWVFPESDQRANVGIMVHADLRKGSQRNLKALFEAYCDSPFLKRRLRGAQRTGRLWGSPIRYALRPAGIHGNGFLMIGEASLLTHPLTGEGISQAFRSARAAAETLRVARETGSFGEEVLELYHGEIHGLFRRNSWKAARIREFLDFPYFMRSFLFLARLVPGLRSWMERRLNLFVL